MYVDKYPTHMVDSQHVHTGIPDPQIEMGKVLGSRLAARRKALQMTQGELAEKVGVDVETISRFERGKHLPSLLTLKQLARHLGSSISVLLGEEEMASSGSLAQLAPAFAILSPEDRDYALQAAHGLCVHLGKRTQ